MNKKIFKKNIKKKLIKMDLTVNEGQLEKFWVYLNFLIKENKKYNLTGLTDINEIINKHFLDSLSFCSYKKINKEENLIDIGTGAGFPGMVIKILYPELEIVLIDSRLKRILFLKKLAKKLELQDKNIEIIHNRAEDLGHKNKYREQFKYVVSRAVASLNILSEYTLPFLQKEGIFVAYKGSKYQKEINESKNAIKLLGGKIVEIIPVFIPGETSEKHLIIIKKIQKTPGKYPRRTGVPKKDPL